MIRICGILVQMVLVAALAVVAPPLARADRSLVKSATSWSYQLQGNVGRIASSNADLVVVDPDHAGSAARFRKKPGGGRRAVLAYLSVGEAERGRPYWKQCCSGGHPSWLTARTQGWAGNYIVRFWEPDWKAIVMARARRFMAMGYDGLYLDRVDTYENVNAPGGSRAAMVSFVKQVATAARAKNGGAAIIVQNAEELLTSGSLSSAIDGIATEDLVHGVDHNGGRNPTRHGQCQRRPPEARQGPRQGDIRRRVPIGQHRRPGCRRNPRHGLRPELRRPQLVELRALTLDSPCVTLWTKCRSHKEHSLRLREIRRDLLCLPLQGKGE